jgi:hypothetical protein
MTSDRDLPGGAEHVDEHDLARPVAHAAVDRVEAGELTGEDLHPIATRPNPLRRLGRQAYDSTCIRPGLESFDLSIGDAGWNVSETDHPGDAVARADR